MTTHAIEQPIITIPVIHLTQFIVMFYKVRKETVNVLIFNKCVY